MSINAPFCSINVLTFTLNQSTSNNVVCIIVFAFFYLFAIMILHDSTALSVFLMVLSETTFPLYAQPLVAAKNFYVPEKTPS